LKKMTKEEFKEKEKETGWGGRRASERLGISRPGVHVNKPS